ncbi:hypothetical protein AB0I69_10535 [Streptomyces sp. NPDC050508]|uniref:hypothetical protein n=1 Tax=Streptomyces sp. NPDC050508 TaxID=3155405 RepID=UPI00341265E4
MPTYKSRFRLVPLSLTAAVISASLLVTGCSGRDQQAGKAGVASLPPVAGSEASRSASGAGASASPGESPGVQLRLDDTAEKRMQIRKIYAACLARNGMGSNANGQVTDAVRRKAEEACKDKAPLQPPELDPVKNPHYDEDVVAVVKCLVSHGVPAVVVPATDSQPMSWTQTSADVPGDYDQINAACTVKSFGSHS